MKPLNQLDNKGKARLLHQLFPTEMPALIDFVQQMCEVLKENENLNRAKWENRLFTFDSWLLLARQVQTQSEKCGQNLHRSSSLFADQLFEGYLACFTIHCIVIYATTRKHKESKFVKMVDLLFNP